MRNAGRGIAFAVLLESKVFRMSFCVTPDKSQMSKPMTVSKGILRKAETENIEVDSSDTFEVIDFTFRPFPLKIGKEPQTVVRTFHYIDFFRKHQFVPAGDIGPEITGKIKSDTGKTFKKIVNTCKSAAFIPLAETILSRVFCFGVSSVDINRIFLPADGKPLKRKFFFFPVPGAKKNGQHAGGIFDSFSRNCCRNARFLKKIPQLPGRKFKQRSL